eukprot:1016029-Rhodomonas_salina.1
MSCSVWQLRYVPCAFPYAPCNVCLPCVPVHLVRFTSNCICTMQLVIPYALMCLVLCFRRWLSLVDPACLSSPSHQRPLDRGSRLFSVAGGSEVRGIARGKRKRGKREEQPGRGERERASCIEVGQSQKGEQGGEERGRGRGRGRERAVGRQELKFQVSFKGRGAFRRAKGDDIAQALGAA